MTFQKSFVAIGAVVLIHVIALTTNLYIIWPQFDIFMHLAGGFAMGLLAIAIQEAAYGKKKLALPNWYERLFVLGFALLVGVLWEFHEFILDQTIVAIHHWARTQPSLGDTMKDLLDDMIGAIAAGWFIKKR